MKGVLYFGQFSGNFGIPIHTRKFASALMKHTDVYLHQILGAQTYDKFYLENQKRFVNQSTAGNLSSDGYVNFIFYYPEHYKNYSFGLYNIGYYIFEVTQLSKFTINDINSLDMICTASSWGCKILKQNKVKIPIVKIPGGVDHDIYNSKNRNLDKKVFKFLHVGKYENRKGTNLILKAFNETFKGDPNVTLTLMCSNIFNGKTSTAVLDLLKRSEVFKYSTDNIIPIDHIEDMTTVYNTHNACLFAPGAEGIGLPITESLSSGCITIAPKHSGIQEYINDDIAIVLKEFESVPIYDPDFFPNSGSFGNWLFPTIESLCKAMKYAVEKNPTDLGKNAEIFMKENYSWDLAAKKFCELDVKITDNKPKPTLKKKIKIDPYRELRVNLGDMIQQVAEPNARPLQRLRQLDRTIRANTIDNRRPFRREPIFAPPRDRN